MPDTATMYCSSTLSLHVSTVNGPLTVKPKEEKKLTLQASTVNGPLAVKPKEEKKLTLKPVL
jgi:hypothetical protein